jgi:hypothetical protein
MVEVIMITSKDLEEKIKQVEKDIDVIKAQGEIGRKLEVLYEYKEYLEDELRLSRNKS